MCNKTQEKENNRIMNTKNTEWNYIWWRKDRNELLNTDYS